MEEARKRVRVAGILREGETILLMHYRYNNHDRYNLPGGNPEPGEPLNNCLQREFMEELKLPIQVGEVVALVETRQGERDVLHILFQVTPAENNPPPQLNPAETHALNLTWLSAGELPNHNLYPEVGTLLGAWLQGHPPSPLYQGTIQQPWY